MGAVGELELFFHLLVLHMEDNHFVPVVTQMLESGEQLFPRTAGEHVGEQNDQRALRYGIRQLMQHLRRHRRLVERHRILLQQLPEAGIHHLHMRGIQPGVRQQLHAVGKET